MFTKRSTDIRARRDGNVSTIMDKNLEAVARAMEAKLGKVRSLVLFHNPAETVIEARGGDQSFGRFAPPGSADFVNAEHGQEAEPYDASSCQPNSSASLTAGFADKWSQPHTEWDQIKRHILQTLVYNHANDMPFYDGGAGQIRLHFEPGSGVYPTDTAQLDNVLWPVGHARSWEAQDHEGLVSVTVHCHHLPFRLPVEGQRGLSVRSCAARPG